MYDNNWNNRNQQEPWEQNFYQTGRTHPPKNRQGLIAVLLVAVIFLAGIISALGILNIRLFKEINHPDGELNAVEFSEDEKQPTTDATTATDPFKPNVGKDVQIELNQSPLSVENIPQAGGFSLQQIYVKAISSVVSISCKSRGGSATGTGVIVSTDGYIVTNSHVVESAETIEILFHDGSTGAAAVVGADTVSDLAVLYVEGMSLTPAEFGDSSALRVGDSVVAIGDPLGIELRGTMTDGIVSAINRDISTGGRTMTLIQTNAALNSGNSGGPLLNCYGQVIGINTMKIGDYMSDAGVEGLGFAIPSTTVKEIVDQLIAKGYVAGRPTLGITGQEISSFDQLYYRIPQGIYITKVEENSAAAQKGICSGDILLQFDGQRVVDPDTLEKLLYAHQAGDTVNVVFYRRGKQYTVQITLDEAQ